MRFLPWVRRGLALLIVGALLTLSGCERALVTEAASYQTARIGDEYETILGEGVTRIGNTITFSDSGRVLLTATLVGEVLLVTSDYVEDGRPVLVDIAEVQAMQELVLAFPELQTSAPCWMQYILILLQIIALFSCVVPVACAALIGTIIGMIYEFLDQCGKKGPLGPMSEAL